jgi:hypothetical protein
MQINITSDKVKHPSSHEQTQVVEVLVADCDDAPYDRPVAIQLDRLDDACCPMPPEATFCRKATWSSTVRASSAS